MYAVNAINVLDAFCSCYTVISAITVQLLYHVQYRSDATSHTPLAPSTLTSEHASACTRVLDTRELTILACVSLESSHILACVALASLHTYT